jgi:hypothetical protein
MKLFPKLLGPLRGKKHRRKIKKKLRENRGDVIAFHAYKTLYFAIPKVANSSFKAISVDILKQELDPEKINPNWKPSIFRNESGRLYLKNNNILIAGKDIPRYMDYWKFAFVRNPWDRLVSCYKEKINDIHSNKNSINSDLPQVLARYGNIFYPMMPFAAFVDAVCKIDDEESDAHFRSQWSFLVDDQGKCLVDFIGHFESIHKDFKIVSEQRGFPECVQLPHLLKSSRSHYSQYYTTALIDKVGQRYHEDIINLNYDSPDISS